MFTRLVTTLFLNEFYGESNYGISQTELSRRRTKRFRAARLHLTMYIKQVSTTSRQKSLALFCYCAVRFVRVFRTLRRSVALQTHFTSTETNAIYQPIKFSNLTSRFQCLFLTLITYNMFKKTPDFSCLADHIHNRAHIQHTTSVMVRSLFHSAANRSGRRCVGEITCIIWVKQN